MTQKFSDIHSHHARHRVQTRKLITPESHTDILRSAAFGRERWTAARFTHLVANQKTWRTKTAMKPRVPALTPTEMAFTFWPSTVGLLLKRD